MIVGTRYLLVTVSHFETPGTPLEFTVVWAKTPARRTASRYLVWHYCSLYKITFFFGTSNFRIVKVIRNVTENIHFRLSDKHMCKIKIEKSSLFQI